MSAHVMSPVISAALAEALATFTREVPTPTEPLKYGVDLSCTDDITERGDEVDPESKLGIGQALYRRLTTKRGTVPDDADYGFDVVELLHKGATAADLRAYAGQIASECRKDDRVDDVEVTVTLSGTDRLRIVIRVTAVDPALEDFELTLAVTDGGALLEAIG